MPSLSKRKTLAKAPRAASAALDPQAVRTWLSVVRAYNLCDLTLAAGLAPLKVRTAEHEILANLLREPGLSQQALAARCFSAKSHISTLLASMEERGWVRRDADPADARAKRLSLTRSGQVLARRTVAVQAAVVQAMTNGFAAADLVFVEDTMREVSARLEAMVL
jgi:DNA-binding MarR family transcriptional regulator